MIPSLQKAMIATLAVALILANIAQPYPDVAPLHHAPTVLLVLLAPWLLRRWPLSDGAVACVLLFFLLHTLGGRYTYSNVPYDAWSSALSGMSISELFGATRNHYDRVVHFAFGLLGVPVLDQIMRRHGAAPPRMAAWLALAGVVAIGALYEIFEWLLAITAAGDLADSYNGQQGDMWDAQKDMALALAGGVIACLAPLRHRQASGQ